MSNRKSQQNELAAIPYGVMNFYNLRKERAYYVDKTHFLPKVEEAGKFLFFIRPRRMGKSLWLSMMECYYDIVLGEKFDELFYDTWIQKNPTEERGSYLVLRLNFADINPMPDQVERSFNSINTVRFDRFTEKYRVYLSPDFQQKSQSLETFADKLSFLFEQIITSGLKLYLLIDEYDNFSNTILTATKDGSKNYQNLTQEEGFFRYFFNMLKGGASMTGEGQIRLFITGVSPITMDDVTSGFNIGTNISLSTQLNDMIGLTEKEVTDLLKTYENAECLPFSSHEALKLMTEWYNNYRFSISAVDTVYNTDMVLYFIQTAMREQTRRPT